MRGRTLTPDDLDHTRAALTAAALSLLEAEGREAVSLRRVAALAGMSRSTPYTYFEDKEALIDAVRVAAIELLCANTQAALAAERTVEARLAASGRAYVGFALTRPALYALIFEAHGGGETHRAAVARYRTIARGPLDEAEALGLLKMEPERLADVLWAATHGLLDLHRAGKLRRPLDEALRDMGDTLAFGFAAPRKEAT